MIQRQETPRPVRFSTERCTITVERLRPGLLLATIAGYDRGEFGMNVLDELTAEVRRSGQAEVFVDAAEAEGATWEVSQQWTAWFSANRDRLKRVHLLVRSRYVLLTVSVAKELSRTGNLIAIYSDPDRFDAALRQHVPERARPSGSADAGDAAST